MTTIAYRDGVIAADTQVSCINGRVGHVTKVGARKGVFWGASGDNAWTHQFHDWMRTGMRGDLQKPPDDSTGGTKSYRTRMLMTR